MRFYRRILPQNLTNEVEKVQNKHAESKKDYVFIGGGHMGRAMALALPRAGICEPQGVLIIDPQANARQQAAAAQLPAAASLAEALEESNDGQQHTITEETLFVLAVKPQAATNAFAAWQNQDGSGELTRHRTTWLSIMAGVRLEAIQRGVGSKAVIRAMPNTPAAIGQGMTVYYAPPTTTNAHQQKAVALLQACGEALALPNENLLDAATAIAGSGPAYLFYLAEHWQATAQELGFSPEQASLLVHTTMQGAVQLWKNSGKNPHTLRQEVTSKGGTTEAALHHFDERHVGPSIAEGIRQAHRRAIALNQPDA